MARGERMGQAPVRAWACLMLSALVLGALGAIALVLRPWSAERTLLPPGTIDLVSRVRGSSLGSHCELARPSLGVVVPWQCGSQAQLAWGAGSGVVQVTDPIARRSCALDADTLEVLGCAEGEADWTFASATDVMIASRARGAGGYALQLVQIDRATGNATVVPRPGGTSPLEFRGTLFLSEPGATPPFFDDGGDEGWAPALYEVARGEVRRLARAEAQAMRVSMYRSTL